MWKGISGPGTSKSQALKQASLWLRPARKWSVPFQLGEADSDGSERQIHNFLLY